MDAVQSPDSNRAAAAGVWTSRLLLVVWALFAVANLAIFITDLFVSYRLLAAPCAGPDCHYQAITTTEAATLGDWGLPVAFYALYMLGISTLPVVVYGVLAAIILAKLYPQPAGMLYSAALLVIPVVAITNFGVLASAFPPLTIPMQLVVVLDQLLLMSFYLVFPRSRFEPGWTIVIPGIAAAINVTTTFYELPISGAQPFTILLLLVVGIIIYRYRRLFDDSERRQLKWVLLGMLVFFAGVPFWSFLFEIATPAAGWATLLTIAGGWTLLNLIMLVLPITIFIAIFRYQLWDIDLILNRTLVYGALTAAIVAVYALIVGGLGALFHAQGNLLLSLLATALIALLFQPARERLQRGVNRLMYGERDDPYAVLSGLARQLEETTVPSETLRAITTTITAGLKLPYAGIIVQAPGGSRTTVAASGGPVASPEEWPLRYQGRVIGWLAVAPRAPGEAFTLQERRLLADIAAQAGAAAYAAQLTAALQRSRERLVLAREEERRRIRRDLHDELGPALASQTFKLDAALDLLETDPAAAGKLLQLLKQRNQELVGDIRRLVYELRPPALDELGLAGALQAHFGQLDQPAVTVSAPSPFPALPAAVEVAAYRIALEAVNNVVRHAGATQCTVALTPAAGTLAVNVADNGRGLPPDSLPGIGLRSMRERAEELGGTFAIGQSRDGGAQIAAVLPIGET